MALLGGACGSSTSCCSRSSRTWWRRLRRPKSRASRRFSSCPIPTLLAYLLGRSAPPDPAIAASSSASAPAIDLTPKPLARSCAVWWVRAARCSSRPRSCCSARRGCSKASRCSLCSSTRSRCGRERRAAWWFVATRTRHCSCRSSDSTDLTLGAADARLRRIGSGSTWRGSGRARDILLLADQVDPAHGHALQAKLRAVRASAGATPRTVSAAVAGSNLS